MSLGCLWLPFAPFFAPQDSLRKSPWAPIGNLSESPWDHLGALGRLPDLIDNWMSRVPKSLSKYKLELAYWNSQLHSAGSAEVVS